MHTKFERLLSKSLTTLEVMSYYLVVHTGPILELVQFFFVGWLLALRLSNMLVYFRDGSAKACVSVAALR